MFRLSSGSAPAQFVLVSAPLLASFAAAGSVALTGYQECLLTQAVTAIAEKAALADVTDDDYDEIISGSLNSLGLSAASVSLSREGGVEVSRGFLPIAFGIELSATGLASLEN